MPVVNKLASETVLQNLRVLATDQNTDKKSEAKVTKTVTLEVDPTEAERLVLAGKMGTLSLVLRPIGDEAPAHEQTGKDLENTTDMRLSGVMREIMKGENSAGSATQVVRVYSGARVENVEVRPYTSVQ
jgi:pilus assembly protein CpaB